MARTAGEERSRANSQEHGEEQPGGVFPKSTYATVCLLPFLCLQDSQRCFSLGNISPLGPEDCANSGWNCRLLRLGNIAYYGLRFAYYGLGVSPTRARKRVEACGSDCPHWSSTICVLD